MTQEIRIIGDLVQVVDISVSRAIPLADWLPLIERRLPVSLPVLPSSTRAVWWDPRSNIQHLIIMLEREPFVAHIRFRERTYAISIPWTRMIFHATTDNPAIEYSWRLDDYKIFWAKNRYTDPNATDMIPALLPNVYRDGRICFGSTGISADNSLADRLDMTINGFYATTFNTDLTIRYPAPYGGMRAWQMATRRDPLVWMTWPDLDLDDHTHDHYSWANISREFGQEEGARNIPIVAPDPIPAIPMSPSFGRVHDWINTLTPYARNALRRALAILPVDPEVLVPEEEDDDDPE